MKLEDAEDAEDLAWMVEHLQGQNRRLREALGPNWVCSQCESGDCSGCVGWPCTCFGRTCEVASCG